MQHGDTMLGNAITEMAIETNRSIDILQNATITRLIQLEKFVMPLISFLSSVVSRMMPVEVAFVTVGTSVTLILHGGARHRDLIAVVPSQSTGCLHSATTYVVAQRSANFVQIKFSLPADGV